MNKIIHFLKIPLSASLFVGELKSQDKGLMAIYVSTTMHLELYLIFNGYVYEKKTPSLHPFRQLESLVHGPLCINNTILMV